jgi:hypothetical protein
MRHESGVTVLPGFSSAERPSNCSTVNRIRPASSVEDGPRFIDFAVPGALGGNPMGFGSVSALSFAIGL